VRYSTTGSNAWGELAAGAALGRHAGSQREVALAHNGNLINAVELHNELAGAGGHVQLDLGLGDHRGALIATHPAERVEERDRGGAAAAEGRVLDGRDDEDRVVAFRDRTGYARCRWVCWSRTPPSPAPSLRRP